MSNISYDSRSDTLAHISAVRSNLDLVRKILVNGSNNDKSTLLYLLSSLSDGNEINEQDMLLIQIVNNTYSAYGRRVSRSNIGTILEQRGIIHDASKLVEPEKSGYDIFKPQLASCKFGSDEYNRIKEQFNEIIKHHYEKNSHHPEHYQNGINGMNLFDVVEMMCDWKAASEQYHGNIYDSVDTNQKRFNYSDRFKLVLTRTIDKCFDNR